MVAVTPNFTYALKLVVMEFLSLLAYLTYFQCDRSIKRRKIFIISGNLLLISGNLLLIY